MFWQAVIFGPEDTPWEGGAFFSPFSFLLLLLFFFVWRLRRCFMPLTPKMRQWLLW